MGKKHLVAALALALVILVVGCAPAATPTPAVGTPGGEETPGAFGTPTVAGTPTGTPAFEEAETPSPLAP